MKRLKSSCAESTGAFYIPWLKIFFLSKIVYMEKSKHKSKLWERGLADFSTRNPLIGFQGKNALRLLVPDPDAFLKRLARAGSMKLQGGGAEGPVQGRRPCFDEAAKIVRTPLSLDETDALASKLRRRSRETLEETGAQILYLACGFLKYCEGGDKRLAPVVLVPVQLLVAKGKEGFALSRSGEPFVNATLLEYLYQAFNINAYRLEDAARSVKETLALLKRETSDMAGWEVTEDVYLATFFFQRFLMWNDLREHFSEFERNANLRALMLGKADMPPMPEGGAHADMDAMQLTQTENSPPMPAIQPHKIEIKESEEAPMPATAGMPTDKPPMPKMAGMTEDMLPLLEEDAAEDMILPLPSDASQRAAVYLSESGKSFVLHGPPGTGKSQTITNMIAHALERGKSVLFVAEKKAALDVVRRRLDEIGVGDFCLELSAPDQGEAFKQFRRTLLLKAEEGEEGAGEYLAMRRHLQNAQNALHQKRDRKSTRLNSSHCRISRMPSSA